MVSSHACSDPDSSECPWGTICRSPGSPPVPLFPLRCSVLQSPGVLISEPQLSLRSSVSLTGDSPFLHHILDGEVTQGGKQGSPRAHLGSSLSCRGQSSLPYVQCCEDNCLINFAWLRLPFRICKMGMIIVLAHWIFERLKRDHAFKA